MIFIGLGSNLGNRKENLERALQKMNQAGIDVVRTSSVYLSKAWGFTEQDDFYNAVAEVSFEGSPHHLLVLLQSIEGDLGRIRTRKWGPRTIDLDILEFNRAVIQEESLVLPHPLYTQRPFVLYPIQELEADWVPTGEEHSIGHLIEKAKGQKPQKLEPIVI